MASFPLFHSKNVCFPTLIFDIVHVIASFCNTPAGHQLQWHVLHIESGGIRQVFKSPECTSTFIRHGLRVGVPTSRGYAVKSLNGWGQLGINWVPLVGPRAKARGVLGYWVLRAQGQFQQCSTAPPFLPTLLPSYEGCASLKCTLHNMLQ